MNIEKTWLWGAAGAVVGLLIGLAVGGDGREAREATLRAQDDLARSVSSLNEAVGRIGQSVADLDGKVSGIGTTVSEVSEQQAGFQGLAARLDQVGTEIDGAVAQLGGAVSDVGSKVTASLGERMDGLRAVLAGVGSRAGGASGEATAEAEAPAAQPAAEGEPVSIGSMIVFGEGAARVFLSGVDPEAGTARVAINGPAPTRVSVGEAVEAGTCSITLTGFAADGATFAGDCGGAGSDEAAAEPATDAVAAAPATGAGTAVAVGAAETLVEGKLRVFLSGIDAGAGSARVAVNGPTTIALKVGEPAEANGCTVTLTGIGDGQATFEGAC